MGRPMRVSRFREEQIVRLLREQELSGQTVESFIRRNGISRHTFYRWRKKYGGLTETEAIRLKRLERENARLKGLLADRELELEVLKEINAKKCSAWRRPIPGTGIDACGPCCTGAGSRSMRSGCTDSGRALASRCPGAGCGGRSGRGRGCVRSPIGPTPCGPTTSSTMPVPTARPSSV